MKIEPLLKIRTTLSKDEENVIKEIEDKISSTIYKSDRAKEYITSIVELLHKGLAHEQTKFLDTVFFDFHLIRERTAQHKKRIYSQLEKIDEYEEGSSEEQTHLVNIYRNIVSDLFDPAINLLVATLQFIEGNYKDIQDTNLGLGERNKYEFAISRMKPTTLFDGYSPIVRNAISHSGTDGIIYEKTSIVFRNIKRGTKPKVDIVKWTNEELSQKTLQLLDFIHAIDNSIEVFGFDVSNLIYANEELTKKFIDKVLSQDQRKELQAESKAQIDKIVENKATDKKDKLNLLTQIYFLECRKRNIPVSSVKFNEADKLVFIEVPTDSIDINIDSEITNRCVELLRYGIVAAPIYSSYYKDFIVGEEKTENKDFLATKISGEDLKGYGNEESSLYDLLDVCKLFINGELAKITVDFARLNELEYLSLDRRYPKKDR